MVWKSRLSGGGLHSHVFRDWGVADGLGGRVEASLATHAAAVAAEALHVAMGTRGVARHAACRRIERILLINVIVITFPV